MTNRTFKSGASREQVSLLPPRIEDYVGRDNPVRAIESFVCALDLAKLGFRRADRAADEMGQPPYDPADLVKLYLYGYTNRVPARVALIQRSGRRRTTAVAGIKRFQEPEPLTEARCYLSYYVDVHNHDHLPGI
jgi:hypothetical protein